MTLSETLRTIFAPPHPVGRPFILGGAIAALAGLLIGTWLVVLGLLFVVFCLYFFRDPERVAPGRPGAVVAPADGRIVSVMPAVPPVELGLGPAPRWRIATFLSVMDVHVNRVPADGTVTRSDQNERNALAIRLVDGREMAVVQIAGLIARRIVCQVREGERVTAGARFGIIRFGSRTDLYLPEGVVPLVAEGQTMIGGETVMADLGVVEPERQA
jgi:phosphatidylserine decarboxylase